MSVPSRPRVATPVLVTPQEASEWPYGKKVTADDPGDRLVANLSYTVATEPKRADEAVAAARQSTDLEWMSALADACGEMPASPDVARERVATLLIEAERRGAARAFVEQAEQIAALDEHIAQTAEWFDMRDPDERLMIYTSSNVTRGKASAAAVHAALMHYGIPHGAVIVLGASPSAIERDCEIIVRDAGRTEVEPGTVTAGTTRRTAAELDDEADADRLELEKHKKATGMDKSLDEYFDDLKDLPKGPIRQRQGGNQ